MTLVSRILSMALGMALSISAQASVDTLSADEPVIQVKAVIEVDGARPEITLGDLIVARGLSETTINALKDVRLADTPRPGESRSFTAVGLEQIFRTHLRDIEEKSGERISVRVPTRVTVVRKSFQLRPAEVETEIKNQLRTLCSDCEFELRGMSLPVVAPTVTAGSTWRIRLRSEMPKGSFSLPLEVMNDDGSKRTYWITGTLAVSRTVPVASRALSIGESIRAEDYTLQSRDVTFANDVAAGPAELESSVTGRQVAAGQVIWRSGLRRMAAVKHGDPVRVITGNESWQITIEGIAQGTGYIGDTVRVKVPRTQKVISGLLKEKGLVEVLQ